MITIEPFRGVRYNNNFAKKMGDLITLPYDKIDEKKKKAYQQKNPYNFVNLILNNHENARHLLNKWMKEGVFTRETNPSIYFYIQEFVHPFTSSFLKRPGIIALLKLEDFGKDIFPHEKTLKKPKEDRLELLRKTNTNFGQIFMLYKDKEDSIVSYLGKNIPDKPLYDFDGEPGTHHILWKIEESSVIEKIKEMFKDKKLFIADGHHRYEVSNIYRKEMETKVNLFSYPENPAFVMVTLVNVFSDSIVILPTHRYIETKDDVKKCILTWKEYFNMERLKGKENAQEQLTHSKGTHSIVMYMDEEYYLITPRMDRIEKFFDKDKGKKWNLLDVNILHRAIISQMRISDIKFFREWNDCISLQRKRPDKSLCFFLNPTDKFDVLEVAGRLEKMPEKSTDFYPKLPSGLVFNKMILKKEEP